MPRVTDHILTTGVDCRCHHHRHHHTPLVWRWHLTLQQESALFDVVALLDAGTAAKAEPLAAEFLEYLEYLDYNNYFDARPTRQVRHACTVLYCTALSCPVLDWVPVEHVC